MASSLASQLAQHASLNSNLLHDRSRKRLTESYLFTGKNADLYDLEGLHALASNGLLQLTSLNPEFGPFESTLFSQASINTDRTLLAKEANQQLDKSIAKFLHLLGPYILEAPTGKVLEWLVRRYRIHQFNVEHVLRTFLPYHESPHFVKMLSILHIKPNSTWSFLLPFKSAAQSLSRFALVTEMFKNHDLALFVIKLLPEAIRSPVPFHRSLLAFNAACLHDYITRAKALDEGTVAALLPALLEPLRNTEAPKDAILGSYILLSTLSHKCDLSEIAVRGIVAAMTSCAQKVSAKQFLSAVISLCEPQLECSAFSDVTVDQFLSLRNMEAEITTAISWVGCEKIIVPMVQRLVLQIEDQSSFSFLSSLIRPPKASTHPRILIPLTKHLLKALMEQPTSQRIREILSSVKNRYPDILQSAKEEVDQEDVSEEEDTTRNLDQVILSLSVVTVSISSLTEDSILASMDADQTVRTTALTSLFSEYKNADPTQRISISSAFLARLHDSSLPVLETLYNTDHSTLVSALLLNPSAYIENLSVALSPNSKPKRAVLRIHLAFFLEHLHNTLKPELKRDAFYSCIYPFLLFSKPRQHTAEVVWDILSEITLNKGDIFNGFPTIWTEFKEVKKEGEDHSAIIHMNEKLVQKLAENIVTSNEYNDHFKTVLALITLNSNAHTINLSQLLVKTIVLRLSGEHQVAAALATLEAYSSHEAVDIDWSKFNIEAEVLNDEGLGKIVMGKPNSAATRELLRVALLHAIATIPPPVGLNLDYITERHSGGDTRGKQYVTVTRQTYIIANKLHNRNVAISLLGRLFTSLDGDTLSFLAGIWCNSNPEISDFVRSSALDYATAFLQAHIPQEGTIDFQTVIPSILVAIQSTSSTTRQGAIKCLQLIHQLTEKKFTSDSIVYGFDVIYGETNRELQYLSHGDLKRYLALLVSHEEHLLHDPGYLYTIHQLHLVTTKEDKKKDTEFKHHVRCYLFSHINAFVVPSAKLTLFRALVGVSDEERGLILAQSLDSLLDDAAREELQNLYGSVLEEYASFLFESFDSEAAHDLNMDDSQLWDLLVQSIHKFLLPGELKSPSETLLRCLGNGLFARLTNRRKIQLCETLLETGVQNADAYSSCRMFLLKLVKDIAVITPLLLTLQPEATGSSPASKKPRLASPPPPILPRLVLLSEVLVSASLPGSVDLISNLLETLNNVIQHASPADTDINFLEQLLMTAIGNIALQITDVPNITPSTIRIDVLVEIIRVSDNPQTFHQALLLTAALARLAPESVLRNIMPVFTFMGSNVFHRDDGYSFRVVQQTIERIIPVMASSLRESSTDRLALYIGARDLLRVFADAHNHIPRHRRTSLFAQLVDVLGSNDFLAPICMLLVEKSSNRITRQSEEDARQTLALPLALLHHYSGQLQLNALVEVLKEAQHLAERLVDPQNIEPHLLDWSTDEDRSPAVNVLLRKRSESLIIFAGLALKTPSSSKPEEPSITSKIEDFVSLLVSLSTMQGSPDVKLEELAAIAQEAMGRSLGFMSANDFIKSTVAILESDQARLQLGAMVLLKDRLPMVSDKTRKESLQNILSIIQAIEIFIRRHPDENGIAFQALSSIGGTMMAGEENSLTEIIPLITSTIRAKKNGSLALDALMPLSYKLGPRIIPHLHDIVKECVSVVRDGQRDTVKSLEVLAHLLRTVPSFCGRKELSQIILLYIDKPQRQDVVEAYLSLAKTLSKKVPAETLLSSLVDAWGGIDYQHHRILAYFQLMTRALRSAPNKVVAENTRPIFDVFVKALDKIKDMKDIEEVEAVVQTSFIQLVVKLNDTAFRPLFRKLYDWAFARDAATDSCKVVFCHFYHGLLEYFKTLMNPYMAFLYQPFLTYLQSPPASASSPSHNPALWLSMIQILTSSMNCENSDEDADDLGGPGISSSFWRDDKLSALTSSLIAQIPSPIVIIGMNNSNEVNGHTNAKDHLTSALSSILTTSSSPAILKHLNLSLLMHTRSPNPTVRQYALDIAGTLWKENGGKLLGFVHDTATFIVESAEDENDGVVQAALKLKEAVESVAGKIDFS